MLDVDRSATGGEGEVIHGLREGVTRERPENSLAAPAIHECLQRTPIRPGSVIPAPAGAVHAILAGTFLCEVQQASDITYRLYDWDRQPPRPIHVGQSLASIDFVPAACRALTFQSAAAARILWIRPGTLKPWSRMKTASTL